MGRGKIEIKKIESIRNRQVSFSKRKGGLLKKAHELSVLTEAQIGLVIFSASGKLYEYSSNNSSVAEIFDKYKKATHFCMQDHNSSSNQELLEEIRRLKHEKAELETCLRQLTVLDLKDHSISEFQHKTPSRRQVAEKQGEREMGFLEGQFSHFGENSYSGLLQLGPQMNPFQMGPTQPNLNGDQIGHYLQL